MRAYTLCYILESRQLLVFKKFQNVNEIKRLINRQNSIQKRAVSLLQKGELNKNDLMATLNKNIGQRRRLSQETINVMVDIFKNEKITSIPTNSFFLFARTTVNPHDGTPSELLLQLNKQDTYIITLAAGETAEKLFSSPRRAWLFDLTDQHITLHLPEQSAEQGLHILLPETTDKPAAKATTSSAAPAKKATAQTHKSAAKDTGKSAPAKAPQKAAAKPAQKTVAKSAAAKPAQKAATKSTAAKTTKQAAPANTKQHAQSSAHSAKSSAAKQAPASVAQKATAPAAQPTSAQSAAPASVAAVTAPAPATPKAAVATADQARKTPAHTAAPAPLPGPQEPEVLIKRLLEAGDAYRVVGLDYGKINMISATDGTEKLLQIPGSVISNHILEYQHAIRQLTRGTIDLDADVELARLTYMLKRYVLKSCRKIVSRLTEFYGDNVIYVTEMHPSLKLDQPQTIILSPDYFYKALFTVLFEMIGSNAAIIQVPNNETSIICPWCGFTNADNRQKEVHQFKCLNCGHTINDDHVAAINIRQRGLRQISEITKHLAVTVPTPAESHPDD